MGTVRTPKPFTDEELEYIAHFCQFESIDQLGLALERPKSSIQSALERMKKNDELEFYRECYQIRYDRFPLSEVIGG